MTSVHPQTLGVGRQVMEGSLTLESHEEQKSCMIKSVLRFIHPLLADTSWLFLILFYFFMAFL